MLAYDGKGNDGNRWGVRLLMVILMELLVVVAVIGVAVAVAVVVHLLLVVWYGC